MNSFAYNFPLRGSNTDNSLQENKVIA
jgi:hypothetical protein